MVGYKRKRSEVKTDLKKLRNYGSFENWMAAVSFLICLELMSFAFFIYFYFFLEFHSLFA